MRKISANYIYQVSCSPIKNGILVLDDKNQIVDVIDTKGKIKEIQDLEFYGGLIVPGFVDVFTLLSYSSFSSEQLINCLRDDFVTQLKNELNTLMPEPSSIQKGINHLEAFGTKGATDFFPTQNLEDKKLKSKVTFCDVDFSQFSLNLQIPENTGKNDIDSPLLMNRYTIMANTKFCTKEDFSERYCVGTGSLGTHQKLSVFEELKIIQQLHPYISIWDLIKWGSLNGAKHLHLDDKLGSIEIGKSPGLNLITKIDYQNKRLTPESELRVLI